MCEIGCSADALLTSYLGFPLKARSNTTTVWKPVIKKFDVKLAGWKEDRLSTGGELF